LRAGAFPVIIRAMLVDRIPTALGIRARVRTRTSVLLVLALAGVAGGANAQEPQTRAERTDYRETSRYADVMAFLGSIQGSPVLHPTTFGHSFEGRPLPLVVVGRGLTTGSAEEVLATGRLRVLLLANSHAGEVEGKEATQMLLRSFAGGEHAAWLDSLVVLVAPIYNADGNERVAVTNRARQHGPEGGVGERGNAQGLDLNRDQMKLASPEARALVGLLHEYDPHVLVDLHSTNGTHHAYHLTYSPPLHPDTDPAITGLLRERWLPEMTRRMLDERGWHFYYYGNAYAPQGRERGWYTFDHRPRFVTNYAGLRNRVGILSEAYSYLDFRGRVEATLAFVEAILDYAHENASTVAAVVGAADAGEIVGERLGVRADFQRDGLVDILMGETEERLSRASGRRYLARRDVVQPEAMAEFGSFRVTEWERVPAVYYLPAGLGPVIDLLTFHGVPVHRLTEARTERLERFVVDSVAVQERAFQGRYERELFGRWEEAQVTLPAGSAVVELTGEPLARLVFHLLEPRADDGVANWDLIELTTAGEQSYYPVFRRPSPSR
jgi:hypothetical protein